MASLIHHPSFPQYPKEGKHLSHSVGAAIKPYKGKTPAQEDRIAGLGRNLAF